MRSARPVGRGRALGSCATAVGGRTGASGGGAGGTSGETLRRSAAASRGASIPGEGQKARADSGEVTGPGPPCQREALTAAFASPCARKQYPGLARGRQGGRFHGGWLLAGRARSGRWPAPARGLGRRGTKAFGGARTGAPPQGPWPRARARGRATFPAPGRAASAPWPSRALRPVAEPSRARARRGARSPGRFLARGARSAPPR